MFFWRRKSDKKQENDHQKITVPADYSSIQAAIDAASCGDVIVVEPGVYSELINFSGKNITLTSTAPEDSEVIRDTVIDAEGDATAIVFNSGESSECQLIGFTVTGGYACSDCGVGGGGIYITGESEPTIQDNLIVGNFSELDGGGIAVDDAWPTLRRNFFEKNRALGTGGALHVGRDAVITESGEFMPDDSEAFSRYLESIAPDSSSSIGDHSSGQEGQIAPGAMGYDDSDEEADDTTRTIIEDNEFINNEAWSGGGVYIVDQEVTIKNNQLKFNQAQRGGAVALWDNSRATLSRNTIEENTAAEEGGGIIVEWGATCVINSNRIAANESPKGGALSAADYCAVRISNNVFVENQRQEEKELLHFWKNEVVRMRNNKFM